jgi:hypothetical protein
MKKITPWDLAYAVDMAVACGISYAIITKVASYAFYRTVGEPVR